MKYIFIVLFLFPILLFAQEGKDANINERLLIACKDKDHSAIIAILDAGADVNYIKKSDPPLSPLLVSTLMGDSTAVSILLARHADVSILNNASFTAACGFGYPSVIQQLIDAGAGYNGDASQALHHLVYKIPRDLKWFFLNGIATEQEMGDISIPSIETEEDQFQYALSVEDKPYLESISIIASHNFPKKNLDEEGFTALDRAIELKNIPFIQKLTSLGFLTERYSFQTIDLAIFAAGQNNIPLLASSLEKEPELLDASNSTGDYLITESFRSHNGNAVDLLLSKKAVLDKSDSHGNNPLHYLAMWGEPKYYDILLPKLKNLVNSKNKEGLSSLYYAARMGRKDLITKMEKFADLTDSSFHLIVHDIIEKNQELGKEDIDIDQLYAIQYLNQKQVFLNGIKNDQTSLEKCVKELPPKGNNLKVIKILVDKTKDVKEINDLLPYFISKYTNDFIQQLIPKGADLAKTMELSIRNSNVTLVNWLLAIKDTPAKRNSAYKEALHRAVIEEDLPICKLLLENGIKPDSKNTHGFTPLDYAIYSSNFQMCRLLLDYGANLDLAQMNPEVVTYLKSINILNMQKLLGVMTLKNQIIAEKINNALTCYDRKLISQELQVFNDNNSMILPPQSIVIDQEPRFWEWFPYIGSGNNELHNKLGYVLHKQRTPLTFIKPQYESTKEENFQVSVSDLGHLPIFDFGQWGSTSQPKELKTILTANNTIPFCSYDPNSPLSYPSVKISNNAYFSNQQLIVEQNSKPPKIILPGDEQAFDRSEGEIKVRYNAASLNAIDVNFNVQYNIGPAISITEDTSLSGRLATYSTLNEARLRLNSAELSYADIQSTKTYIYVLSLKALEKKYDDISQRELIKVVSELNNIEGKISELYNITFSTNILVAKSRIVELIRSILNQGNLTDIETIAFKDFEAKVLTTVTETDLNLIVGNFLKQGVFVNIENKVFEIQLLMLETAQYLCIEDLEARVNYVKNNFINKKLINPAKLIVVPNDLAGKGSKIINALKI